MPNQHALIAALTFALAGAALTACGGAGASPNLAPQAHVAPSVISNDASKPNLGGQYAGTVNDSLYGGGRIYAQLVQYRNAVGGNFSFTYGSTTIEGPGVFLLKGATLTGLGMTANLSLVPCTVSENAMHGNLALNGSYTAVRGCSGDNGTYTMQESCRYGTHSVALGRSALKVCGGAGAGASPNLASQAQLAPSLTSNDSSMSNLSGEYAGTVQDSIFGSGKAYALVLQYHNAVGATMTLEYGSTVFINPNVFLFSQGSTLTGTGEGATLSGVSCKLSETAMHSGLRLSGSYKAVNGCSGESGTFTIKEQCRFVTNSIGEARFALKDCYTF